MPPRPVPPSCTFMCVIRSRRGPAWMARSIARWSTGSGQAASTSSSISPPARAHALHPAPATNMKLPVQRVEHVLALLPDICSLDMGSMNMGGYVFVNTPSYLEAMAITIRDADVLPELEVFEAGHLLLARRMIETGHIKAPGMFQICLGIAWGQPATPEAMAYMRGLLPKE